MDLILYYLFLINAVGLFLMLADKLKARKNKWRIPEVTLLGASVLGGSLGILMGMYIFRHKTRHPMFSIGVPIILVLQIILTLLWINR